MYSIRTKILAITLVFIAFLGTAFVLYSIATTGNYKLLRLETIEKTVGFETEKVNKLIVEMEDGALHLAVDGLLFYKSQSYEIAEISALEFLRGFPAAIGGGFWFEPFAYNKDTLRACVYAYSDRETDEVNLDYFVVDDYNYHDQDWYREIADKITRPYQVVWTKPYVDDTSFCMMTSAGAGIFDEEGNFLGISLIDWEIDKVIQELTAIKPTKNSFVLLCSPWQDYIISNTYSNMAAAESVRSLPWDINADSFILDGVRYFSFNRIMDNAWFLSIQIPEKEIFAEIENRNSRFSLIIALSSIVMLWFAYMLISKLINTPIKRLTTAVARLALGNLDTNIEVTSRDELGVLAETFNKMKADLKDSIAAIAREQAEKERITAELNVAAEIQASMLPCVYPPFPDRTEFDICASMYPAKEVGGDFYDFYLLDENNLAVVIADVSGKGMPAALFMVVAKTLIKNYGACESPKRIFETVNNKLCENNDANMFVTAFMGFYNIPSGRLVFVNAGHNPPLIKKGQKDYEFLRTKLNPAMGYMENIVYTEEEVNLESGDAIFLFTDGVTESMNNGREAFSEERLLEVMKEYRDYQPKELLVAVKDKIEAFVDGAKQADDIAMLSMEIKRHGTVESAIEELDYEELDYIEENT